MKYKHLGCEVVPSCTPPGRTLFDNRSCREINHCTRECTPKRLKCDWCGEMNSLLNVLEDTETGKRISICNKCERSIEEK